MDKQKESVIKLLSIIENEDFHYGIVHYGVMDVLKDIGDDNLNKLAESFISSSKELETYIENLEKKYNITEEDFESYEEEE